MTKAKILEVWAVHKGDDDIHNGSPEWWYSDEGMARAKAKGNGWYGGNAPVKKYKVLFLPASISPTGKQSYYLIDEDINIDLDQKNEDAQAVAKIKALAKLTSEDKEALGIK